MKNFRSIMAASLLGLATSCVNEQVISESNCIEKQYTLEVNVGTDSRTVMENGVNVWTENDAVYVFSEDMSVYGVLKIDMQTVTNEGRSAKFTGYVNGDKPLKKVIYPANKYVNGTIPAPSNFKIEMGHVEGVDHNAPMQGTIGDSNSSIFDYVGGLVKFQITGITNKEVVFDAKYNNASITGGYYELENGTLKFVQTDETVKTTTIHNFPADGIVYLPIAIDVKAQEGQTTPMASITAYAQENPDNKIADIIKATDNFQVGVSKGDISTNDVPNYEIDNSGVVSASKFIESSEDLNTAFTNGGKYKLSANLQGTFKLNSGKTVTLDLNEKTIECNNSDVFVVENGTLILEGNGTVYAAKNNMSAGNAVWVCGENPENAKAIIKGGTYKVGDDERSDNNSRNDCIYLGTTVTGKEQYGGSIEIQGGTFKYEGGEANNGSKLCDGHVFLINQANQIPTQCIVISGGKFYRFDPAEADTDDTWMYVNNEYKPGSYLKAGYGVSKNDKTGYFEVIAK